jgi:hypothetical protein
VNPTYCRDQNGEGYWVDCTTYDGYKAASYADTYALHANILDYIGPLPEDCTNFVSQALQAGGHSFTFALSDPQSPQPQVLDLSKSWWAWRDNGRYGSGRTKSWSVTNDLYSFVHLSDPYWPYEGVQDMGTQGMTPLVFMPLDDHDPNTSWEYRAAPVGTIIFYKWQYQGDAYVPDHASIIVDYGTDPEKGWSGALIDQHTNNRYHAIWNLIPYNSQWATTLTVDAYPGMWGLNTGPSQQNAMARSRRMTPQPRVSVPAPTVPDLSSIALAPVAPPQAAQLTSVFERAMIDRQQLASPSGPPDIGELSAVFTGDELRREHAALTDAAAIQANTDIRAFGGGADSFNYSRIATSSNSEAILAGSYRAWSRVGQVQKDGRIVPATPSNTIDYIAQLSRESDGRWRVSSFSWSFAPGSEP